jgi:putative ABC transport system permease protein
MINETSRKLFGFETNEAAIGKKINRWDRNYSVVGVLKDYNHHSLKSAVDPTVIFFDKHGNNTEYISIKVNEGNIPGEAYKKVLTEIRQKYDQVYPVSDFDYYFLDEKFNQQYKADQQFGKVFTIFAGLAIFISVLGLFGLVLSEVQQRVKEIGVRKVLGANPFEIVSLLSKNFMRLIGVSIVISILLSFYLIQNWLDAYASRISVGWTLFVFPAIILSAVALITIGLQSYRAANQNPINALRYE